jgi:AraC family transcriptional regulator of adaptative response/methylated-DNA-[protein]-cysteine methyltransferase
VAEGAWIFSWQNPGFVAGCGLMNTHLECATADEIAAGGAGMTIRAGISDSPFGRCLIGETPRGICHLSYFDDEGAEPSIAEMRETWPLATIVWDHDRAGQLASGMFSPNADAGSPAVWKVFVHGTDFQIRVWKELLRIPLGSTVSYGELATAVGNPKAFRSTGTAVGRNPISLLIPCHRVIRSDGSYGNYRWGNQRKCAILAWEALRLTTEGKFH